MPDPEIENKVKQIIVDELGVDENEVTPNARFIDDLGADSLDTVELVMRFEEEFGIEIPDEDAEKITRVKEAVDGLLNVAFFEASIHNDHCLVLSHLLLLWTQAYRRRPARAKRSSGRGLRQLPLPRRC